MGEAIISTSLDDILTVNFSEETVDGAGSAVFTGTFESIDELNFSTPDGQLSMDDLLVAVEV